MTTGRPRIGDAAMSSTERSRRHRAKQCATKPATKPARNETPPSATKVTGDDSAIRIRELEEQVSRLQAEVKAGRDRELGLAREIARQVDRPFLMTEENFKNLLFCSHPDRIAHLKDETLTARFDRAFRLLASLKDCLINPEAEKQHREDEKETQLWREAFLRRDAERYAQKMKRKEKAAAAKKRKAETADAAP